MTLTSPSAGAQLLGTSMMLALYLLICAAVIRSRLPRVAKLIVVGGVILRLAGALARNSIAADSNVYYHWGLEYARYFASLNFSPLTDPSLWRSQSWLGTNFVAYPVGLVIALIGPARRAVFFCFALLSLGGVAGYAVAFRRAFPEKPFVAYWAWLFLFPSLWFWPSSIGKESLMMLGLGVATLGFVGTGNRENWPMVVLGLLLVFAVRPQVCAVFVLALTLSHALAFGEWNAQRVIRTATIVGVGTLGIWFALAHSGAGGVDPSQVQAYVATHAESSDIGGSAVQVAPLSLAGLPLAIANVLFRPFPWEAHNARIFIAALETVAMWLLVLLRRRQLRRALSGWRHNRVLRLAVPFFVIYTVALGFSVSNLGIIDRQRSLILPVLFLIVEAGSGDPTRRREGGPDRAAAVDHQVWAASSAS